MGRLLDAVFGDRLARQTAAYLAQISSQSEKAARLSADQLLGRFQKAPVATVRLGSTAWGASVEVPLSDLAQAYGLVTGGTGSGKSMFGLLLIQELIRQVDRFGFGVLDAKGELYQGALWLLRQRLEELVRTDPEAAKALRRRIIIIDFSSRDPLSSYNLLARSGNTDPEFFALSRADLIMDLLEGDHLSLGGTAVLQKLLLLLSEFDLPITWVSDLIRDEALRQRLLQNSKNPDLVRYFTQQFDSVPKSTLLAIERRIEALAASESVRLALSGTAAPDFRRLQDERFIVLINCFGESIPSPGECRWK
ncbi:MAG TPA: hypothetical protein VFB00_08195 [Terriglobales bacterium]|nr:hypothetical protein [Terriglobales bacterium]